MIRTTMICIGPSGQRFHSRLFNLFDQQSVPLLSFVSIRLEDKIWTKFQIEGSDNRILRLKAKLQGLTGVELCADGQIAQLCSIPRTVEDGLSSLGGSIARKRDDRTFRGLQ